MRQLGKTDIRISPIGLGCWQFSRGTGMAGKYWDPLDDSTVRDIVDESLKGGVTWFDTAEMYGRGRSEESLSGALKALNRSPGTVVIATKWWPLFRTARSIIRTVDDRLNALGGFPIDLHQIHWPYSLSTLKRQMDAMVTLLEEGKIRSIGVSNFSARQMEMCHRLLSERGHVLASNQVRYNLLDRRIETNGVLETARELGITIIAYSPLAQGILTGKFHDDPSLIRTRQGARRRRRAFQESGLKKTAPLIAKLRDLGQKYQVSPSQVALNWVIHSQGEIVVAIPGASKARQARENAAAMSFELSENELASLQQKSPRE